MSIPVLVQVYDEVRRLAIAGSAVASGDFRLKKLIPPLEKSGEKAPVFAKVAQAATAVVDSTEKTASPALLDLATLVNAILYTQGETGIAGDFAPLATVDLGTEATQASARVLKPLLEALRSTGSGRLELIRDAFARGAFKDLRLVKPALRAIDDPYAEIAELIALKVLPLYGKAVLPELRSTFEINGRGGHVHRLKLMHALDPEGTRELVKTALEDGSKEIRVAAIECLGRADDDVVFLLDQTKAKAKDVRAAAIKMLATSGIVRPDVIAALKKVIAGTDLEVFTPHASVCTIGEIQAYALDQAEQQTKKLLRSKDKKEQGTAVIRVMQLISCLQGRTDAKAEAFLLGCFENAAKFAAIKSEPAGVNVNEWIAHVLANGTAPMRERLVAVWKTLAGGSLTPAMFAARPLRSPADFFQEFSPVLKSYSEKRGKKGSLEQERGTALLSVLTADRENGENRYWLNGEWHELEGDVGKMPELDPRWLDAAIEAGDVDLVCTLARRGHTATQRFLSECLGSRKEPHELHSVLRTMVRIGHPDATDALIEMLKKQAKSTSYYYFSYWFGPLIADLPRSSLPKIEEFLPSLPDKMIDQLMDAVMALKNKPE